MAQAKKIPYFEYRVGVKGKHGISFKGLSKSHKRFLIDHQMLKRYVNNPGVTAALFAIHKPINHGLKEKLFYDRRDGSLKKIDGIFKSYSTVDWECAISRRPIKSRMNDFSPQNFVHPDYWDTLSGGISESIVKSSIEFRQKCEKLLLNQQKELMQIFKSNAKPRKELE